MATTSSWLGAGALKMANVADFHGELPCAKWTREHMPQLTIASRSAQMLIEYALTFQVNGFNHVLNSMFPRPASQHSMAPVSHTLKEMREAAAAATDRAKANVLSSVNRT